MTLIDEKIAEMERHLKTLSEKLDKMKATKKKEKAKKSTSKPATQDKEKEREKPRPKTASKTPAKSPARPPSKAPEKKKAPVKRHKPAYTSSDEDIPVITFEQKKELSDAINNFEGDKLANVVQIIHSSMPHLRDVSFYF